MPLWILARSEGARIIRLDGGSLGSVGFVGFDVPQEFRSRFGQNCVDEHAGTKFKTGHSSEPGNHAEIPVKVTCAFIIGGPAANGEIEIGIFQAHVYLRQQIAQDARQIRYFGGRDLAEAGHVA